MFDDAKFRIVLAPEPFHRDERLEHQGEVGRHHDRMLADDRGELPDERADAEPRTQWARETWRAIEPMTDGFYVNDVANDDPERRIRANYGANYDRLVKLKNKYDPTNLFRMNANVKPSV